MEITITEALSEINLIKKKIDKKRAVVIQNLFRAKNMKDQFEKEGGAKKYLSSEMQAIRDLTERQLKIKNAIAEANIKNTVEINGQKRTIHDWLNWKRDISKSAIDFVSQSHKILKQHFDQLQRQPQVYKDEEGKTHLVEYEANIEYGDLLKSDEELNDTLEKLDGQLSLKNATIVINV